MEKKITAWVARDENGILFMYTNKPKKDKTSCTWYDPEFFGMGINKNDYFPDVKWENKEPTKVELTIKICE